MSMKRVHTVSGDVMKHGRSSAICAFQHKARLFFFFAGIRLVSKERDIKKK